MKTGIDYSAICLDFSHQNLKQFPINILNCRNLRMLCLEGNELEGIPTELFTKIERLTWLDLRNNKIKEIPCTIGACKSLETLLIQDNNIEHLPMELGLLPNLKSLHLSGNPIKYPKSEILQSGICGIVQFLKAEYDSLFDQKRPKSENECQTKEKLDEQSDKKVQKNRKTSHSKKLSNTKLINSLFTTEIKKTLNVKPVKFYRNDLNKKSKKIKELKKDSLRGTNKNRGDSKEITSVEEVPPTTETSTPLHSSKIVKTTIKNTHLPVKNSDRYLQRSSNQRNELKAQENALREYWTEQLRDLLQQQASIIQHRKTIESLKEWRLKVDKYRALSATKLDNQTPPPFDIDPEFLKMPNRSDLQLNSTPKKKTRRTQKEKIDFNKQIDEIIKSIKFLDTLTNVSLTPSKEQQLLDSEIRKLTRIQKQINNLKAANNAFQLK